VKHFFYIPPVLVVWQRTASPTGAFVTVFFSGSQFVAPKKTSEAIDRAVGVTVLPTCVLDVPGSSLNQPAVYRFFVVLFSLTCFLEIFT
jgi:hypothetical protein